MTIAAGNIIISESRDALNDALRKLGSGAPMFTQDNKDVFLFSTQNNPNIISFNYSLMGSETEAILEIIDPKNEFEDLYVNTQSAFLSLGRYLSYGQPEEKNVIEKKEEKEILKTTKDLNKLASAEFKNIVDLSKTKYFYLSFGVGPNPQYWSPVQRLIVTGIVLDPSKTRKITIRFAPVPRALDKDNRKGLYGQQLDAFLYGYKTRITSYSDELDFYGNARKGTPIYGDDDLYDVDIHKLVSDVVTRFIKKFTGGANVVFLLPNLNITLSKYWERVRAESTTGGSGPSFDYENKFFAVQTLLKKLGLQLTVAPKAPMTATQANGGTGVNAVVVSFLEKGITGGVSLKALDNLYENNYFYASMEVSDTGKTPDALEKVKSVINKILKVSGDSYVSYPIYVAESDMELLDILSDRPGFDSNRDTYIIGDASFINALVYSGDQMKDLAGYIYEDDLNFFGNGSYIQKIKEKNRIKNPGYLLGNLYSVPDKFAFADVEGVTDIDEDLEKQAIPIFRYNTQSPNVLSIKAKDEGTYFANLALSFAANVDRVAQFVKEGGGINIRENDFEIKDQAGIAKAVLGNMYSAFGPALDNKELITKILNKLSPDLAKDVYDEGNEIRQKAIASFVEAISRNGNAMTVEIEEELEQSPPQLMDRFAEAITRVTRSATIETLPFFNLATRGALVSKPVILLAEDAPVKTSGKVKRSKFNRFLTGLYFITGLKHTISSGKCHSEFQLAKIDMTTQLKQVEVSNPSTQTSRLVTVPKNSETIPTYNEVPAPNSYKKL
tara:strand:- start:23200 stop:25548 length:2349 start_codon:yes stop_codon:yes gene_type:complete